MSTIPVHVDKDSALAALISILSSARDGSISNAEAAAALDDLVDSGPWDELDDPLFVGLVDAVDALIPDSFNLWHAFDRDPAKIRTRADAAEAAGNAEKAARMRARADRVEAKQAGDA